MNVPPHPLWRSRWDLLAGRVATVDKFTLMRTRSEVTPDLVHIMNED